MSDTKTYTDGCAMFYKKVKSHMKRVEREVAEKDKREKKAVKDWFYRKKEAEW